MSFLAVDQGNTRTKFGIFEDGVLAHAWAVDTDKHATAGELATAISLGAPASSRLGFTIGLCTVTPETIPAWQQLARERDCPLSLLTGESTTPLMNAYETPATLGPDRLMAAVAAAHLVGTPVIPIMLGTATVVDAVSPAGAYLGGMIAPGIGLATHTLAAVASALQPVDWHENARAIGHSTAESMQSGLYHHHLGALRAMIAATRDELGTPAPLALTGGWASRLASHLDGVALTDDHLVLRGIAITLGRWFHPN